MPSIRPLSLCRHAILALAVALTTLAANAESHYSPHISVGARAGMSMSRMSFSPSVPQSWQNGMVMGITARYAEEKIFGIIGELNFEQRGWKETFEDNPGLEYNRRLTYISLPVMTHIYFGPRRFKFFFNAGPQIGYMISSGINSNFDYNNPAAEGIASTRRVNQMHMDIKNKFDYGITAGLGMEWWATPRNSFVVEGRFYYGLGNIFPSSKADEFSASRSMTLQITAAYNFRLK